jgi:hypothetical protein
MVLVKEKSDALQEKLTSGLKKRFFYETKVCVVIFLYFMPWWL